MPCSGEVSHTCEPFLRRNDKDLSQNRCMMSAGKVGLMLKLKLRDLLSLNALAGLSAILLCVVLVTDPGVRALLG